MFDRTEFRFDVPTEQARVVKEFLHGQGIQWTTQPSVRLLFCQRGCGCARTIRGPGGEWKHEVCPTQIGPSLSEQADWMASTSEGDAEQHLPAIPETLHQHDTTCDDFPASCPEVVKTEGTQ